MQRFHLTRIGKRWHLAAETSDRPAETFKGRREAIARSRAYLRNRDALLIIHGEGGEIECTEKFSVVDPPCRDSESEPRNPHV